jgi:RimJ/RimL family protein N-acetyltransferase
MELSLHTPRLTIAPIRARDEECLCELLSHPDVCRHLCDGVRLPREGVRQLTAESCDASSGTSYWRMATETQPCVGMVGLRPPSMASLALRAIGWRSRELIIALHPRYWGQGLAKETVAAIADYAGRDGVTFALVAGVDVPDTRSHRLMQRCGFLELGRRSGATHPIVIYERAL